MKKLIFNIIICTLFHTLQAQTIEGTVYDANTGKTIPGVVVYLDGTAIYTTSDTIGNFRLTVEQMSNTRLVFSHILYDIMVIERPFEHSGKTFFLSEKINTIAELRVVADRYTHADKMKLFREQFLGKSAAGQSCVILNEDEIVLNYDQVTNRLMGYANSPIIIENRYLAYRITYDLREFAIQYSENTLSMTKATRVSFKGTSSYVDQSPYNILFATRREQVYLRSRQYFWKSFIARTLQEDKFRIFNRLRQIEPYEYFIVSSSPSQKIVAIIPDTNINRRHPYVNEGIVHGVIRVSWDNNPSSEIVFLTNRFSVDEFGNPDTIDNIIYFGEMGDQRIGDMLPQDFVYTQTTSQR